jgi:glutamate formiminotransferase / 5-formyltetrahydrofolate cyclo-ligase
MIECVPNVSEGRRGDVIDAIAEAIRASAGTALLDCSADPSHNRSVFTFAGDAAPIEASVLALFEYAVAHIDLRTHSGEHPRVGAVDVVPFIPLDGSTMAECVALAERVGRQVAERFGIPVYLYEQAARIPARKPLEEIRRGGFEGLAAKMKTDEWRPDFGPRGPHPTAGASVIGARTLLIAFNVNLQSNDLEIAKAIASMVRQRGGGLPAVKAMGVRLNDAVQVSMNLTNFRQTSVRQAFEAVRAEAARRGVEVRNSEIVGLVPAAALSTDDARAIRLMDSSDKTIEGRLRRDG